MRYLILVFVTLFFLGCSGKIDAITPNEQNSSVAVSDSFEDEFESEFEEEKHEVSDPLVGYNRAMTAFNDRVYRYALNPAAKGYAFMVPQPARVGVSNFFSNLKFPIHFTNNLLQLKFDNSMHELARFMINSTVGVLGFIDVAEYAGIEPHEEDFGQTLGHYGVGSGFHLVLPFLGSSNLRDTIGLGVDMYASPVDYMHQP
ncbi:MAG: VacJ family lipoprotein, partial [Epsilonproteobacteria bacterium]|nr:VacJ family lipoprotein [Campylobacterota bacterium]